MDLIAGPEVRNFDQLQPGATVKARYVVTLSARRLDADEPDVEPSVEVVTARAEPGEAPGAAIGTGMVMTVVIKTVDLEKNVVTFTDPDGVLHAVEAERDEGKAFIKGLKPDDRVVLTYDEVFVLAAE